MKVLHIYGTQDSLRWGDLGFGNHRRRFTLDRLTGSVRLYDMGEQHQNAALPKEDTDPELVRRARQAIADALGLD